MKSLLIVLGNQLFDKSNHPKEITDIFMCEDLDLCTYEKHHKKKISFFLTSMREYRDEMVNSGYKLHYKDFNDGFESSFISKLKQAISTIKPNKVFIYEIEDKEFETKLLDFLENQTVDFEILQSPMFIHDRSYFNDYQEGKRTLLLENFYRKTRKELNILMEDGKPLGGQWNYDELNRKKIPKGLEIPVNKKYSSAHLSTVNEFIDQNFTDHPGNTSEDFWVPFNRNQTLEYLDEFFEIKFELFGPYEDAIYDNHSFLFHSAISPLLNIGLLTPMEVIEKAIAFSKSNKTSINSVEGFIRQIMGWREFIRGVYQTRSYKQIGHNFFKNERKLTQDWYDGTTGIDPLDNAIKLTLEHGYTHHINRLMVISNIMNLSGIHPNEIYKWFMEMFVDSSEWVMVPNVYGMGTFADAGVFSTKPYICGSSYIMKMSNFKKGPWCDIVDGLYWSFIKNNLEYFKTNPRLAVMPRALERLKPERTQLIFSAADNFVKQKTD
jgi:deoxyribodipyrimidine photolyase-related protein